MDGEPADTRFNSLSGLAIDAEGNVIVADSGNNCIRKVAPDGTVTTLAGSRDGEEGFADGEPADARFDIPNALAIDGEGNVIVADWNNNCISKLSNCGLARGAAVPRWHVGPASLASGMMQMLQDEDFTDATFAIEGTRLAAHRAVLSVRSTYFRSMLKSNCREAQPRAVIQVGETAAAAFRLLLAYLYTDALDGLDDEVVLDVMRKARE